MIAYDSGQLVAFFLRLPADRIVELNFLIESYDGVGVVRTLDAGRGEVVVLASQDMAGEMQMVLSSIADSLDIHPIPTPASVESDWLLCSNS